MTMQKTALITTFIAAALVLGSGCSARRGEPLHGPLDISDPAVARGQLVFMRECYQCHPGGDAGLGPAINNKPLPGFLMKFQVRNGLGAMPAFSQQEIASEELEDLVSYLKALRNHSAKRST
jgi:mono/diheme cytochrome c family protein